MIDPRAIAVIISLALAMLIEVTFLQRSPRHEVTQPECDTDTHCEALFGVDEVTQRWHDLNTQRHTQRRAS